jgi:hypothetical protein
MSDQSTTSWERFLNPDTLRPNLIAASIYISSFEILKTTIVDRIKDFFTNGFDQNGWRVSPEYQSTVLSKNRSAAYASLAWLKERDAIDDSDMAAFEKVKELRNKLAHQLSRVLFDGLPSDFPDRLREMVSLVDKIERWWIIYFEIPLNSDLNDEDIAVDQVMPGPIMGLRILLDVALGSEEESRKYLQGFGERTREESQL